MLILGIITVTRGRALLLLPVTTLQSSCRDVILTRIKKSSIDSLPLPQRLKDYLLSYFV